MESYVVLVLGPFFMDIASAIAGGSPMSWELDRGSRKALIPRAGAPLAGWAPTPYGCGTPRTPLTIPSPWTARRTWCSTLDKTSSQVR